MSSLWTTETVNPFLWRRGRVVQFFFYVSWISVVFNTSQYTKAVRCGDLESANIIKDVTDALSALRHGKKTKNEWTMGVDQNCSYGEILENKCVQVPVFQEKLRTAKQSTTFVEATFNNEWGSGLDRKGTQNTKPEHWPGSNTLVVLLKKISKKLENEN